VIMIAIRGEKKSEREKEQRERERVNAEELFFASIKRVILLARCFLRKRSCGFTNPVCKISRCVEGCFLRKVRAEFCVFYALFTRLLCMLTLYACSLHVSS
jgi:hypothetical protein